jgi:hypothetical protein
MAISYPVASMLRNGPHAPLPMSRCRSLDEG